MASGHAKDGAVKIHQDAEFFISVLDRGKSLEHTLDKGRHAWIQAARGAVEVNGMVLDQGDGAAVSDERKLSLMAKSPAEILLFDLN